MLPLLSVAALWYDPAILARVWRAWLPHPPPPALRSSPPHYTVLADVVLTLPPGPVLGLYKTVTQRQLGRPPGAPFGESLGSLLCDDAPDQKRF